LAINVIDFYRRVKGKENIFTEALESPTFYILSYVNGKMRELTLKLSGKVECPPLNSFKDFDVESYRSYLMITDFLLGENGESVRRRWGLSKGDFRDLVFKLYFTLVREHSTCNLFKKVILLLLGMWKYIMGREAE
jgi:hypothetical protein